MDYQQTFGAIPSPVDVRDYIIARSNIPASTTFPKEFELSNLPDSKNQGSINACVAFATAWVIEWFSRQQGDSNDEFSTGYIYGNREDSTHTGEGMILRDALAAICKRGDVIKNLFPYIKEVPEIITLFEKHKDSLFEKGYPNRFSSYYRVMEDDEIKTALMSNSPVVITMRWYTALTVVDGVMTINDYTTKSGYHCMVIYGWDERGWKIQNSWGKYWGKDGRAILPYDIHIDEAYGVVDTISENATAQKILRLEEDNRAKQEKIDELNKVITKYIDEIRSLNTVIEELRFNINTLIDENTNLAIENEDTENQLYQIKQQREMLEFELNDKTAKVDELTKSLGNTLLQLSNTQDTVEKQDKEITDLENTILELKKPFSSPFGKVVAKIANFVIRLYEALKDKFKK